MGGEQTPHDYGAAQVPIVRSAAFAYPDAAQGRAVLDGQAKGHTYRRSTDLTVAVFEEKIRLLEGSEAVTSFASGMAATSNTLFAIVYAGDHVVSIKEPMA